MGADKSETKINLQATLSTNILSEIGSLLQTHEHLNDFTVIVDGVEIKCNSLILKACSEYFRRLFNVDMLEKRTNELTLKDVSIETFQTLWDMLSTGKVCINLDNVIPVWYAADKLQMTSVFNVCEEYLAQEITDDNFCEMYCHARMLCSSKVIRSCWSFIESNFTSFCQSNVFKTLQFEEMEALVEGRSLNVQTEDQVIEAIFIWVENTNSNSVSGITFSTSQDNEKDCMSSYASAVLDTQSHTDIAQQACTELLTSTDQGDLENQSETELSCQNTEQMKSLRDPSDPSFSTTDHQSDDSSNRMKYLAKLLQASKLSFVSSKCLTDALSRVISLGYKDALETVLNVVKDQHASLTLALEMSSRSVYLGMLFVQAKKKGGTIIIYNRFVTFSNGEIIDISEYDTTNISKEGNDLMQRPLLAASRSTFVLCFQVHVVDFIDNNNRGDFPLQYSHGSWQRSNCEHICLCAMAATQSGTLYGVRSDNHSVVTKSGNRWRDVGYLCSKQGSIANLIEFGGKLVVFYHGYPSAAIEVFCLQEKSSHLLEVKETSLNDSHVTFTHHNETFLLHNNGALYKLIDAGNTVHVELVSKLWPSDIPVQVHGAGVDRETLFVFAFNLNEDETDQFSRFPRFVSKFPLRLKVIELNKSLRGKISTLVPASTNVSMKGDAWSLQPRA